MTAAELWNRLDVLASSKDTSNALLETAELLREHEDLPLLIGCRRSGDRIHHLYTVFDERNPDATGNRYLICFTSAKQAKKKPILPPEVADTHDNGPVFSDDDPSLPIKKRRRKGVNTWLTTEGGEVAKVSVKKILTNMQRNRAIGGLIFNPYDEKRSMAIAKFLF